MEISDKVNQLTKVQPAAIQKPESKEAVKSDGSAVLAGDKVDISPEGAQKALISQVAKVATEAPDIDYAKVDSIKQAIADGRYQSDSMKIAEAILEEADILSRL